VTQTITRDLADINLRVKEASTELRRERVRLISERVKQVGKRHQNVTYTSPIIDYLILK
jgi:hypothetical protein